MLEAGVAAPQFTLIDQHGKPFSLSDHRGRWVVFWWYPFAGTPG